MPDSRRRSAQYFPDAFRIVNALLKVPAMEPEMPENSRPWNQNEHCTLREWEVHARHCNACFDAYGAQKSGKQLCYDGETVAQILDDRFISWNGGQDIYNRKDLDKAIQLDVRYRRTRDLFRAIERSVARPEELPLVPRLRSSSRRARKWSLSRKSSESSDASRDRSASPAVLDVPDLEHSPDPARTRTRSPFGDERLYEEAKDIRSKSPVHRNRPRSAQPEATTLPLPTQRVGTIARDSSTLPRTAPVSQPQPLRHPPIMLDRTLPPAPEVQAFKSKSPSLRNRPLPAQHQPKAEAPPAGLVTEMPERQATTQREVQPRPPPSTPPMTPPPQFIAAPQSQRQSPVTPDRSYAPSFTDSASTTSSTSTQQTTSRRQSVFLRPSSRRGKDREQSTSPKKDSRRSSIVVVPGSAFDNARRRISFIEQDDEVELRVPREKRQSFNPYWVRRPLHD